MKVEHIIKLADICYQIEDGHSWFVANQTQPGFWSDPDKPIQWYIDANWLIKTDNGLLYDPTK